MTVRSVKCQLNFDGRLESVGGSLLVSASCHPGSDDEDDEDDGDHEQRQLFSPRS